MQAETVASNQPGLASELAAGVVGGNEHVLRVLDLAKTYRVGFWRRRVRAVQGISFAVAPGRVFALLGHNGAGKTTTMKAILDLVHADAGQIEIFGRDHRAPEARARLGYLPESPSFHEHLTGAELLDYYGRLYGLAAGDRRRRAKEMLALVGLEQQARLRLSKYSKGMLQRIGLAQALLNDPELLILDEPMSGLDPLGRRQVRDLLGELKRRGKSILLSSHIVPDIEVLADDVAILRQGKLHSLHDLTAQRAAQSFDVILDSLPGTLDAQVALQPCRVAPVGVGRPEVSVGVPDVSTLCGLLAACEAHATQVLSVTTRQRNLEEIFLAALHQDPGAPDLDVADLLAVGSDVRLDATSRLETSVPRSFDSSWSPECRGEK